MKHIDIVRTAKVNNEPITWIATIPTNSLNILTVNGINMVTTNRNYYLDTKAMKVRYETMSTEGASYDILLDIYVEFYPGIYIAYSIATENNITDKLQDAAEATKNATPEQIEELRVSLVRVGK